MGKKNLNQERGNKTSPGPRAGLLMPGWGMELLLKASDRDNRDPVYDKTKKEHSMAECKH